MRVVITGGWGTLAGYLKRARSLADCDVLAPSRDELDVTDERSVPAYLERERPGLVVHAAAVIRARGADSARQRRAMSRVNVFGTALVARATAAVGARLVYISTDFVFDGSRPGGMYREDDAPCPLGYYALTKFAGEQVALDYATALAVRTSFCADGAWPYPGAFVDRFTSKLKASVAAEEIARAARSPLVGVLHIGGPRQSYYDFARTLSADVAPIHMQDVASPDPMAVDTSLDSTRWRSHRDSSADG